MTDVVRELISDLKEDAEWAHANEWETPITLGDHLEAAAEMIESLCSELEKTQALAEARLKRKNMYKERSERSLFEQERYRLDLQKEQEMRQHADEVATLFMQENEKLKRELAAAMEDIRKAAWCGCHVCKHYYQPDFDKRVYSCKKFGDFDKHDFIADDGSIFCGAMEWRGLQEK